MCRKRKMLPSIFHTKNPQPVDKAVDNLGKICLSIYARHSSYSYMPIRLGRMDSCLRLYNQIVFGILVPPAFDYILREKVILDYL